MAQARDDMIKALLTGELVRSAREGNIGQINLYLQKGGDVNCTDADGNPLITIALAHRQSEASKHLLANGANPNSRNAPGQPVLLLSLDHKDNNGLTHALIDAGADVNACSADGTPLFFTAVQKIQDLKMIQKMLGKSLDIMATNATGQTIFDVMQEWEYRTHDGEWSQSKKNTWRDYLIQLLPDSKGPIGTTTAPKPIDPRVQEDTQSAPMPTLPKKRLDGQAPGAGGPP